MKTTLKIIALLALATVLALAWRQFFPGDKARIQKMLTGMAATLSRSGQSSPISMMLALDQVRDCLSPKIQLSIEAPGLGRASFGSRDELMEAVQVAWTRAKGMKVEFCDIVVTLGDDGESATAELTARASQPGAADLYLQEFKLELKKQEQKWRITKIAPFEVFSR